MGYEFESRVSLIFMTYSSLHTHDHFSLDGVGTTKQWVIGAKKKGLHGLAITNHGGCENLLELYTIGKKEKFNTMMGCEFYLIKELGEKDYYHLTVVAYNFQGYQNLCRLSTLATQRNAEASPFNQFYRKPRITLNQFFEHKEGLIVCSGCLAGPINKEFLLGNEGLAEDYIKEFHKQLGDNYFIEVQPSYVVDDGVPKQELANKNLLKLAKKYDIPLVITPDAHMINEADVVLQKIKTNTNAGKKGWEFSETYHLYSPDELLEKVKKDHPYLEKYLEECCKNTNLIMDKGQFEMPEFKPLLPNFDITTHPLYAPDALTDRKLLIKILFDNGRIDFDDSNQVDRLKYEMDTLFDNGRVNFMSYFLLLEDVIRWAKENKIVVGPGRGSASGSLLSYGLGITQVDPIKFDLSFERFINKGRIVTGSLPDVDLDFSDNKAIKDYVKRKYGKDNVASLGVYQTLKSKGAIKDVLKFLRPEMSFEEVNYLTSPLPTSPQGEDELTFFHENLEKFPTLMDFMTENKDVYTSVIQILGQARQKGIHPCAYAISPVPLNDIIPLWDDNGEWVTQYSMEWCEKAGIVKFDFLKLDTLMDISYAIQLIEKNHGIEIDAYNLPLDDKKTLQAFSIADTETVFQFHTYIPQKLLKEMRADSIYDLAAITSLGRPGPMDVGMDKTYVKRKIGEEEVEYLHDSLHAVLEKTYGILVYQEQVTESVQKLGGFSLEEADDIRRAMGKKKPELLKSYKDRFTDYAVKNFDDIDEKRANSIWEKIESFSRYGFNKSHAIAYALIGYICQFLKVHYPLEWFCSVITNASKDKRKDMFHLVEDKIALPDVNTTKEDFYIENDKIISSISMVEGVGATSIKEILSKQPFMSFEDFYTRINKRVVRKDIFYALILSGCFDSFGKSRNELLGDYFELKVGKREILETKLANLNEMDQKRYFYHYLSIGNIDYAEIYADKIDDVINSFEYVLEKAAHHKEVCVVGRIEKITPKVTKKGDAFAFVTIVNKGKNLKTIFWPETYKLIKDDEKLDKDAIVKINGSVNIWNDMISVVSDSFEFLE